MAGACRSQSSREEFGAVGRAVVSDHPLDGDAQSAAFGGQYPGIGEPRGIIDGDVQEVPAMPPCCRACPVAEAESDDLYR